MKRARRGEGVVVLGAGLAGLSAALHAGGGVRVFEASARVGGVCATDHVGAFFFDRSGHLLHVRRPAMRRWVERLLPGAWHACRRDARIHVQGRDVRYPIQANTYGLDGNTRGACLLDYLRAATAPSVKSKHFQAWARAHFGEELTRLFFDPYNRKLWTLSTDKLTTEWLGRFIPKPEVARVVEGAFRERSFDEGYNAVFWYPRRGGMGALAEAMAARIPGITLSAPAWRVDPRRRTVDIHGHGTVAWRRLISTLPLPALVARLKRPPRAVVAAAHRLRTNSVLVVNLAFQRRLHPAHWVYFPESDYVFYRVGFPSNYGRISPPGVHVLAAEIALPAGTGWDRRRALANRVRRDLIRAGVLSKEDTAVAEHLQYLPYGYVIFDRAYAAARRTILTYLAKNGIRSIGRWGGWEYSAMEDALVSGQEAAAEASLGGGKKRGKKM